MMLSSHDNIRPDRQAPHFLFQVLNAQPASAANFTAFNAITSQQARAIGGGAIGAKLAHDAAINTREAFPYRSPEPMLFSLNSLEFRPANKEQVLTTVFPIVQLHLTGLPFPVVTHEPHILPYPVIDNKIISYSGPVPEVKRPLIFSGNPNQYQEDKKVIGPDYVLHKTENIVKNKKPKKINKKIECDNGLTYQDAPYHGKVSSPVKSRAPSNPKDNLEKSVKVKPTSSQRISYDASNLSSTNKKMIYR